MYQVESPLSVNNGFVFNKLVLHPSPNVPLLTGGLLEQVLVNLGLALCNPTVSGRLGLPNTACRVYVPPWSITLVPTYNSAVS